jgi:hypothetical protein
MKDVCKACGSDNIQAGYGMAYGGMGVYLACEDCGQLQEKFQDPEMMIFGPHNEGGTADCEKHGEYEAAKGCDGCINEHTEQIIEKLRNTPSPEET